MTGKLFLCCDPLSNRIYAVPLLCVTARRSEMAEVVSPTVWGMASPPVLARHALETSASTGNRVTPIAKKG